MKISVQRHTREPTINQTLAIVGYQGTGRAVEAGETITIEYLGITKL